jgi:hypothetical protein
LDKWGCKLKKSAFLLLIIIITNYFLNGESLWDDKAGDIYNRKIYYNEGDSINVIITESSSIDYKSNSKSLKTYGFDITGKELTGIFTFLPKGNSEETENSQSKDTLKINSEIQGRIISAIGNSVTIQARKQIIIDNKSSVMEITGDANLKDIKGNSIFSTKLINPTLRITTLLDNTRTIINPNDLKTTIINPDSTTDRKTETTLNDGKKRELMLYYFNKILNVIF